MNILDDLKRDHERLRGEMDALEAAPPAPARVAGFIRDLVVHAHAEDDLLFRELEKGMPPDHGPLAVMREEHEEIESGLERVSRMDPAGEELRSELRRTFRIAREHFLKEEEVLFAFAERLIDEERLEDLGRLFRDRSTTANAVS